MRSFQLKCNNNITGLPIYKCRDGFMAGGAITARGHVRGVHSYNSLLAPPPRFGISESPS